MRSLWELELSNGSGSQSLGLELLLFFKTLLIASVNMVALACCELESGVSLSVRLWCVDPRCVDIMVGVGGWVGGWVIGLEFPEWSRRVKLSTMPALRELWVKH